MKRRDFILILVLLLISAGSYIWIKQTANDGKQVTVTVDKKIVLAHSLDKSMSYEIPLTQGENKILIKDGQVTMQTADCPDQVCVKHKAISKTGETIVCLPHKVVVEITGDQESDIDVVAQ